MFHSVSLLSQVPLARGSCAIPSVLLEKHLAVPPSPFLFTIRECGITLCRVVTCDPSTNTKFKPLLIPTQMGMPYTNTHKYRTSYFKSRPTFLGPAKLWKFLSTGQKPEIVVVLHNNNFKIFFSNIVSNEIPPRSGVQMLTKLISIGSYSPEIRTFGTLIMCINLVRLIICKFV